MGWAQPIFFWLSVFAVRTPMGLDDLLEKTLPALGYELAGWESSPRSGLVRVFIDKPKGVDVEDCARVSHHLTRLFAVENVPFERLEVSSPGIDRHVLHRKQPGEVIATRILHVDSLRLVDEHADEPAPGRALPSGRCVAQRRQRLFQQIVRPIGARTANTESQYGGTQKKRLI